MKLFVWEDVLHDYTSGMMVALAPDVESARAALKAKCQYVPADDLAKEPLVIEINDKTKAHAFIIWGGG